MLSYLRELIGTNPFVEEIDFENKGISTLDPHSVELLGRFQELKRINLADNHIRKLPNDLSPLHQIQEFNLNGNPIDDIEAAVDSLQSMPNLKVLFINLHEEEQVDYLLRTLASLQYLNGLAVEREALFNDEDEEAEGQEEEGDQINENEEHENNHQQNEQQEDAQEEEEDYDDQQEVVVEEANEELEATERVNDNDDYQMNLNCQDQINNDSFAHNNNNQFFDNQQQDHQQNSYQQLNEEYLMKQNSQDFKQQNLLNIQNEEQERMSQITNDLDENDGQNLLQQDSFQIIDQNISEENELKASDLENIAILYDQVRCLRRKTEHNIDKKLAEDFDSHLKKVMYDLSVSLQEIQQQQNENDNEIMKKKIILKTKKSLIEICQNKAVEYFQKSDKDIFNIFSQLLGYENRLFESSLNIINTSLDFSKGLYDENQRLQHQLSTQPTINVSKSHNNESFIQRKIDEHDKIKDNIIDGLQKTVQTQDEELLGLKRQLNLKEQQIGKLQNDLEKNQKETADILEAAETLEKESNKNGQMYQNLQSEFQEQKEYYELQLKSLEEENKKLLETLIRHSKNKASGNSHVNGQNTNFSSITMKENQNSSQNLMGYPSQSHQSVIAMQPFGNQSQNTINSNKNSVSQLSMNNNMKPQYQHSTIQSQQQFYQQPLTQNNVTISQSNFNGTMHTQSSGALGHKILPLKQLKDVINDIYSQKIKYDIKCRESKLPIETMEQYMYTYLNQKYGLKSLIIEWASTIIHGVRTYLKDDHEITLFGKILKNECDEEFRFIQMHVKDTLSNLLKILIREKFHLKSEGEIIQLCDQIQNSAIDDPYWKKIITKMYDCDDVNMLTQRFQEMIQYRKQTQNFNSSMNQRDKSNNTRKLSREEEIQKRKQLRQENKLLYADFLKIILDFQLSEHEKFLSSFTQIFKSVDTDSNGILDENQFRDLIIKMNIVNTMDEVEQLLAIVDPHNNKQMTYSEIVQLLSSQMTSMSDNNTRQVPLLEKFVNQMQIMMNIHQQNSEEDGMNQYYGGQTEGEDEGYGESVDQNEQQQQQQWLQQNNEQYIRMEVSNKYKNKGGRQQQQHQQQLNQDLEIL